MSNFDFLTEWPELQEHAKQAEAVVNPDPRSSCFYSRYTLERLVQWMYEFNSRQIRFVNTIIDYLTQNGVMSPAMLAKPPFSDIHFEGGFGLFDHGVVVDLKNRINVFENLAMGG